MLFYCSNRKVTKAHVGSNEWAVAVPHECAEHDGSGWPVGDMGFRTPEKVKEVVSGAYRAS